MDCPVAVPTSRPRSGPPICGCHLGTRTGRGDRAAPHPPDTRFGEPQALGFALVPATADAGRIVFECHDMPMMIGVLRRQPTLMCGAYPGASAAEISAP